MHFYLIISEPEGEVEAAAELKFFEWLKYLKKSSRVTQYWALRSRPGLAAVLKLNFEKDLEELLDGWKQRLPSKFTVEPLKDPKTLEADLARKILG